LSLAPGPNGVRLGLFPTTAMAAGEVTLPGDEPLTFDAQLSPDQPLVQDLVLEPAVPRQARST